MAVELHDEDSIAAQLSLYAKKGRFQNQRAPSRASIILTCLLILWLPRIKCVRCTWRTELSYGIRSCLLSHTWYHKPEPRPTRGSWKVWKVCNFVKSAVSTREKFHNVKFFKNILSTSAFLYHIQIEFAWFWCAWIYFVRGVSTLITLFKKRKVKYSSGSTGVKV